MQKSCDLFAFCMQARTNRVAASRGPRKMGERKKGEKKKGENREEKRGRVKNKKDNSKIGEFER